MNQETIVLLENLFWKEIVIQTEIYKEEELADFKVRQEIYSNIDALICTFALEQNITTSEITETLIQVFNLQRGRY